VSGREQAETILFFNHLTLASERIKKIKVYEPSETENWRTFLSGAGTVHGERQSE
jgi:hypothetical protein